MIGAVPIKSSIYALPNIPEAREDFEWLRKDILQLKGEASVFVADSLHEIHNREIISAFQKARTADFARLIETLGKLQA
jgi:hypothetical protein